MTTKKRRNAASDLISRAELARRAGVVRSSVTRACNTRLAAAVAGDRVDANHPAVQKWLREGNRAPTDPKKRRKSGRGEPTAIPLLEGPEAVSSAGPTASDFTALTYRKRKAEVEELELRLETRAGRLISTELVRQLVFQWLDHVSHRLLTDLVQTAAIRMLAAARAGGSLEDLRAVLYQGISTELEGAKRQTLRGIAQCRKAAMAGQPPPPLEAFPPAAADTGTSRQVADVVAAIAAELRNEAAAKVVDFTAKSIARRAPEAGLALDALLQLIPAATASATHTVGLVLAAHVDRAIFRITAKATHDAQESHEQDAPR